MLGNMAGRSPKTGVQVTAAQRGEETRQRLLAAAVELVQEVGWGAVSTRAIAQRAGVPPGLVHYHFRSVTDLLVDATVPAVTGMVDELLAVLETAQDVPAGIDTLLAAVAGYAADWAANDQASRLTGEAFLAATRVPRLQAELAAVLARARAVFADWLRRHGYPGEAEPAATVLVAALDGLVLHRTVDQRLDVMAAAGPLRALAAGAAHPPTKSTRGGTEHG
jgi:AcrR family transcriptional regulator